MERMTRRACTVFGSVAATCKAPRTGAEVKTCTVLHTLSKALRLGRIVREARRTHADPVQAILDAEHGVALFRGKVSDVQRRTSEGWLRGTLQIDGLDAHAGHVFQLEFQNEYAIGREDGEVRVTVPDLICVLDSVSGEAIGTETVRYGQRVTVVGVARAADPAHAKGPATRRPARLRLRFGVSLGVFRRDDEEPAPRPLAGEGRGEGRPMIRAGIDVGGTNTDAVLLQGSTVLAAAKQPTTADVTSGVIGSLRRVLEQSIAPTASMR